MKLTIKNQIQLTAWIDERRKLNHDIISIKGAAPVGATYSDGELIVRPVNIGWCDIITGEIMNIDYCEK